MVLFVLNRKEKENRKATLHVSPSGLNELRILLLDPRLLFCSVYDGLRKTPRVFDYSCVRSCLLPQNREREENAWLGRRLTGGRNCWTSLQQATVGEGDLVDELRAAGERRRCSVHTHRWEPKR